MSDMPASITPTELNELLQSGDIALLDVRDAGSYNSAHIPGATSLPRARIEYDLPHLVPYRGSKIVFCDDAGQQASFAAETARSMGYGDVTTLAGGVNLWAYEDLPTRWGTNVPSKDFGERMEVEHGVPEIDALRLKELIDSGQPLVILDTRTPQEFHNFCIPGGRSMPNGELPMHITDVVREAGEDATVVLNCAGRTRSIIGTRALQRMGVPRVYGLKNGTAGWVLAGLRLQTGANPEPMPKVSPEGEAAAAEYAASAAAEDGVRLIDVHRLREIMEKRATEPVYLVDVRREEEFRQGHIPGFRWFPGGQAVQRSDDVVAIPNATVVFACDGRVRAPLVASWFRQMGYPNVYAVTQATVDWSANGWDLAYGLPAEQPFGLAAAAAEVDIMSAQEALDGSPPLCVFVGSSAQFADGHLHGSDWTPRGWLEQRIAEVAPDRSEPLLVTCANGMDSLLAAAALRRMSYRNVCVLDGGVDRWRALGLEVEQGLANVMTPPNDVVVMGPFRPHADTINYLRWEEELGHKYRPLRGG